MFAKCGRADQTDFFTRPTDENDSAPKFFRILCAFLCQRRSYFHHPCRARSVIIGAGMDFIFFAGAIERAAATVAEMIVVRAHRNVFRI